jgi:glycosyltransferase involved in cell wall biosynthesis
VVVQTERVGAWARAFCPRVHVIPNFVERPAQVARPGIEHGPRKLLGLGRLAPEKGFDLLVRAFALVARSHPDWTLEILGEGKERTRLEALAGALGVRDRVSMPGSVVHPLPRLAAAHAFALPSRYEGFPNALLEAMACGLPVVAFDCQSGPREIIVHGQDGLLVRPGDTAEMALALDRLLGNAAERVRLGRNATEVTVRFAPETVLQRWSALLTGEDLP